MKKVLDWIDYRINVYAFGGHCEYFSAMVVVVVAYTFWFIFGM